MLDIVERVVDKESQFRYDAHLVLDACAQLVANLLSVGIHVGKNLFALSAWEDA